MTNSTNTNDKILKSAYLLGYSLAFDEFAAVVCPYEENSQEARAFWEGVEQAYDVV
jgi:hypothetical protein